MSNCSANILRPFVQLFILDVTKKEFTFYRIFHFWYLQTYKMFYWIYFSITSTTFVQVYPLVRVLQHQLLLVTAKVLSPQPRVTPDSEAHSGSQSSTTGGVNSFGKENIPSGGGPNRLTPSSRSSGRASPNTPTKREMPDTPLRPVNLNKEDWSRPGPSYHLLSTMNIQVEERSPADNWM